MTAADQKGYQPPRRPPGTPLADTGRAPARVSNMATAAIRTKIAAVATWYGRKSCLLDPAVLLRDVDVELVVVVEELLDVVTGAVVGVETVVLHELLPVGGVEHLLEHIGPELRLHRA